MTRAWWATSVSRLTTRRRGRLARGAAHRARGRGRRAAPNAVPNPPHGLWVCRSVAAANPSQTDLARAWVRRAGPARWPPPDRRSAAMKRALATILFLTLAALGPGAGFAAADEPEPFDPPEVGHVAPVDDAEPFHDRVVRSEARTQDLKRLESAAAGRPTVTSTATPSSCRSPPPTLTSPRPTRRSSISSVRSFTAVR